MKTIEINLYKFSELSEDAKQNAINKLSNINVEFDWWQSTYEDAARIGLKLTAFDLDRNRNAKGEFITSAFEVAEKILSDHGEDCETYKTAINYKKEFLEIDNSEPKTSEAENEKQDNIDYLNEEFLKNILEDYSIILQKECEYLQSETSIIETIEANDYDFTEDGELY